MNTEQQRGLIIGTAISAFGILGVIAGSVEAELLTEPHGSMLIGYLALVLSGVVFLFGMIILGNVVWEGVTARE